MSVEIWDKFCVTNPAHMRLRMTETTGSKLKRELGFPTWSFQIHGSVCWSQRSRVCWHSPCSVCSGINPRVKSGRFMKILPDYEHMEYRDVYTCRTYPTAAAASCTQHARDAAWRVCPGLEQSTGGDRGQPGRCHQGVAGVCQRTLWGGSVSRAGTEVCWSFFFEDLVAQNRSTHSARWELLPFSRK